MKKNKTLLLGWSGADWNIVMSMLDKEELPNLNMLVEKGTLSKLLGVIPSSDVVAWTSIITGKRPYKHNILGDWETAKDDHLKPITCVSRHSKALWNIISQNNLRSNIVSWPVSHPAEQILGTVVSNEFSKSVSHIDDTNNIPLDSVFSDKELFELKHLRMLISEVSVSDLKSFIPKISLLKNTSNFLVAKLAQIIAESATTHAVATELIQAEDWDFTAVYYDGLKQLAMNFMNYHPPKPKFVSDADFEIFSDVIKIGYQFFDMMLGSLLSTIDENTNICLVSQQGAQAGNKRDGLQDDELNGPRLKTEPGILIAKGPHFKQDELITGSSVLDICPTILHLMGINVGNDMDGKVLFNSLINTPTIQYMDSWEDISGNCGQHPQSMQLDPLIKTYNHFDPFNLNHLNNSELRYNLAESYIDANKEGIATKILQELWEEEPAESRYGNKLMLCYMAIGRTDLARKCLDKFIARKKEYAPKALKQWKQLELIPANNLTSIEKITKTKFWKQSRSNFSGLAYMHAWLLHAEKEYSEALEVISLANEDQVYNKVGLVKLKADCFFEQGLMDEALKQYQRVIELDNKNTEAYIGLSRIYYESSKFDKAAIMASNSIAIRYFNPLAHYLYGVSVYKNGTPKLAADALKVAVEQSPTLIGAFQRLAMLYAGPLNDKGLTIYYSSRMKQAKLDKEQFDINRSKGFVCN